MIINTSSSGRCIYSSNVGYEIKNGNFETEGNNGGYTVYMQLSSEAYANGVTAQISRAELLKVKNLVLLV